MLKNDYILKNDEYIFKSQAVDSYLSINTAGSVYIDAYISGLTEGTSINVFYKTPTATIKRTCSNSGSAYFSFPATNETSYKSIYFCGDLDSITCIQPRTQCVDGKYTGDFVGFINQFPNLTSINMGCREFDFNQDISYSEIPRNVTSFYLYDCGIAGDITTIKNIGNVKCWCLNQTRNLSGNFHDINFNGNLECTHLYYDTSLCVNIECLVNNNPNYNFSYIYYTPSILCADNVDVSNLKYIYWYLPFPATVKGEFDNWTFNSGLTHFYLYTPICGDMTTWDISNTNITTFNVCGYNYNQNVSGDMSAWVLPDTLTTFNLGYLGNVTSIPTDYSNTSLSYLNIYQLPKLSGDVTTFMFPTGTTISFSVYYTSLSGNLENFTRITTGATSLNLQNNCFTGNLSGITLSPNVNYVYFSNNYLTGKVNDLNFPTTLYYLYLHHNPDICLDLTTSFDTKNISLLDLSYISGVTGNFSNLTVGNSLRTLSINGTNVPDINDLNLNQICKLCFYNSSLSEDITNKFTGTTNVYCLCLGNNSYLSGDTTNWDVDNMSVFHVESTSLSGALKHACPLCLNVSSTKINSCINTDWDLTQRAACVTAYASCIRGDLSTIDLNYSTICYFRVYSNPYLSGSTGFANKVFDERKSFTKSNVNLNWQLIADAVTGTTETLGSLGTYTGHQWDLTETEVNNLAAGLDYDGLGSNQCWDPKQKMYWVKYACVGSSSTTRRYPLTIAYSCS